ncbi:MAG: hypothetical protein C0524_18030 [Rhodobacter sp.]|nr:hypothetical protein [Rhodobacter sp.]
MTRRATSALLLVLSGLLPTSLQAQDDAICDRGEGAFYGHTFTLEQIYRLDPEPPAAQPGTGLFPDPGDFSTETGSSEFDCEGGSLVGALTCVAEEIEASGSGDGAGPADEASGISEVEAAARRAADETAPELEAAAEGEPASPPRELRQILALRPVLIPGSPGQMRYEVAGPGTILTPEGLTEDEIARVAPMISAQNAALLDMRVVLDADAQEALVDGIARPVPLPGLLDGVSRPDNGPTLAMGAECGSLFRAMAERARLALLREAKVARIKQLKDMLKAERDKAGLLGLLWDSEQADRIERIIAEEERRLGIIDRSLGEQQAIIDRRERVLTRDEREREIAAIKADPDRLAAESAKRRESLIAAAQEVANARWRFIEGEAAYAREIASRDAMIKAARESSEDDLADALEVDKGRLEAARDSWREHAQAMIDTRTREAAALVDQNVADGIGPTSDAASMLLAEGKNPVEVLEAGARERAIDSAQRRAAADAVSLGGNATETYGVADFGQDLFETNLEMAKDPLLFYKRYGHYAKGVGEAAYDGVVDLAKIGVEAGDLAGEAFESGLSELTGYEFNTYGRENLDTLVAAGSAISQADALKIGEMAGEVAAMADRKFERMAASGERGIEEALETTGYVVGSVAGAEEIAIAGALKAASIAGDVIRGTDALTDAARTVENLSDAARAADAARGATRAADAVTDVTRAGDAATDATRTVGDLADAAAAGGRTADAPPVADVPATRPKPDEPAPDDFPTAVDRDAATQPDPDATRTEPAPDDAPPPVDREAATGVDPDGTRTEPAPDDSPTAVDRDAATQPDLDATRTEPAPDDAPPPVDREAATGVDPDGTRTEPAPDDTPTAVDRDAATQPDLDATRTEPAPDDAPPPVDREAATEVDPDGTRTEPAPDDTPSPVDREAATEGDPDTTRSEPAPDENPGPVDPDETLPPEDLTEPPLTATPDTGLAARPDEAVPVSPAAADPANPARGPPAAPARTVTPINESRLDVDLDESPGYRFGEPLFDPARIPEGSAITGTPVSLKGPDGEVRSLPGNRITAPNGAVVELGEVLGTGATASIFRKADDPSKVVRVVDYQDPGSIALDAVGRKVGEAIQNPTGNGNFRMTRSDGDFTVTDPTSGKKWLVSVEENITEAGTGFTNAKQRFAASPPNPEQELTMALAMREMNNRGVVWTDHKPANFDIIANSDAPTGYQMVIFDTGGIRPVSGATAEARAATAREIQRVFDQSPKPNSLEFNTFKSSYFKSALHLDDRVFGGAVEVGVSFTPNLITRKDGYLELAGLSDAELVDRAIALGFDGMSLPIAPP